MEWISTNDKLPPLNTKVMVTTGWGTVTFAERWSNTWVVQDGSASTLTNDVLAWMELPEPYSAKSEIRTHDCYYDCYFRGDDSATTTAEFNAYNSAKEEQCKSRSYLIPSNIGG